MQGAEGPWATVSNAPHGGPSLPDIVLAALVTHSGVKLLVSGGSARPVLWFRFTWGLATQLCFHFGLSCEFPSFLSSVSGVLAELCGDSFEIVQ